MDDHPVKSMSAPRILLAKPSAGPAAQPAAKAVHGEDESNVRSRIHSLNLLSDKWDFHIDRVLPFMTDNTNFTVIGVIGPTGAGKSTVLNELYGFYPNSPGMLPPFATQTEESRYLARHCTTGIDIRVSSERLILLDTQPVFSASVLADIIRPDGSSLLNVLNGESLSADLAHELAGIQLGVFLASVCHILLVISEGAHDTAMWQLMTTIDLLKHEIPDPSLLASHSSTKRSAQDDAETLLQADEFLCTPVFVHTKLEDYDLCSRNINCLTAASRQYFSHSSFGTLKNGLVSANIKDRRADKNLFLLPLRLSDSSQGSSCQTYESMLEKLRNQVLSMKFCPFKKLICEREWLRNSARIWDLVKRSPVISDYCKILKSSGLFRN